MTTPGREFHLHGARNRFNLSSLQANASGRHQHMTAIDQQVSVTNQTGSFPFQSLLNRVHSNHSSA